MCTSSVTNSNTIEARNTRESTKGRLLQEKLKTRTKKLNHLILNSEKLLHKNMHRFAHQDIVINYYALFQISSLAWPEFIAYSTNTKHLVYYQDA